MIHHSLTILTLNQPNTGDFAKARNLLLKDVKTPWVLFLDSDEVISEHLKQELTNLLDNNPQFDAYKLSRRDIFLGRKLKYGETGSASFVRLAKKDWGKWQGKVHENWVGKGRVGKLKNPLIHTPHPSLSSFVAKINNYSTLAAKERYEKGVRSSLLQIILYPVAKFINNYVLKLGFLDGVPGLIHAYFMSWHSYATWTKLYLLCHKK